MDFQPEHLATHSPAHYRIKAGRCVAFISLFGLQVDPQTESNWAELISLGRSIDNFVDTSPSSDLLARECAVLEYLGGGMSPSYDNLCRLSEQRRSRLIGLTGSIFELNRLFKLSTDPKQFCSLRSAEAICYADMFVVTAEEATTSQPKFSTFSNVFRRLGVAANLGNSAVGLRHDRAEGQTSLGAGFRTSLYLCGQALHSLGSPNQTVAEHGLPGNEAADSC